MNWIGLNRIESSNHSVSDWSDQHVILIKDYDGTNYTLSEEERFWCMLHSLHLEHGSKNRSGGLAQLRHENKCVPCFAVPEKSPQCLVHLLDRYLTSYHSLPLTVMFCTANLRDLPPLMTKLLGANLFP